MDVRAATDLNLILLGINLHYRYCGFRDDELNIATMLKISHSLQRLELPSVDKF